jgi:hypothetical protein
VGFTIPDGVLRLKPSTLATQAHQFASLVVMANLRNWLSLHLDERGSADSFASVF